MIKNILLLEDDKALNMFYKAILEDAGYNVLADVNGNHLCKYMSEFKFDLIITDMVMEGIEGIEIVSKLRSNGHTMPILVMSSNSLYASNASDIGEAIGEGKMGVLVKPFSASELVLKADEMLS